MLPVPVPAPVVDGVVAVGAVEAAGVVVEVVDCAVPDCSPPSFLILSANPNLKALI